MTSLSSVLSAVHPAFSTASALTPPGWAECDGGMRVTVYSFFTILEPNMKSPANTNGNAQQRCMFESPVKQSLCFYYSRHRAPDDRRLIIYSVLRVLARGRDLSRSANAVSAGNRTFFSTFLSCCALVRGDPFQIYGKTLRFLKLESSRQPTVKIW